MSTLVVQQRPLCFRFLQRVHAVLPRLRGLCSEPVEAARDEFMAHIILDFIDILAKNDKLIIDADTVREEGRMRLIWKLERAHIAGGALPEPLIGQIVDLLFLLFTFYFIFLGIMMIKLELYLQQIYQAIHKFYGIMQYVPNPHANVLVVSRFITAFLEYYRELAPRSTLVQVCHFCALPSLHYLAGFQDRVDYRLLAPSCHNQLV